MMRAAALALLLATPAAAAQGPAERATRAALARIAARNPRLHAVIAIDPTAIAQARAIDRARRAPPLAGRAVLIKDNIETRDQPTTAGSLALAANARGRDAPLVAGLRAGGAVIVGKANLSEWANFRSSHSVSGWSAIGGQTRNPHDPTRSPCGSSSGSAAAVAAGMVDLAIGTETDGSITCPAAMNGVVGLKPTLGLVSRAGVVPISPAQDTPGPIARSVRDAALLLDAIAAPGHGGFAAALDGDALRGARIGVMRFDTGFSPKTDDVFEHALAVLRVRGAVLVDIAASGIDLGSDEHRALAGEFRAAIQAYLADAPAAVKVRSLNDLIAFDRAHAAREMALFGQETFEEAAASDDAATREARARVRGRASEGLDRLIGDNRVVALIGPTAGPTVPIDHVNGDRFVRGASAGGFAAVAGYPHLTVPMGAVEGLPVGLSLIGPAGSDARLLALGYAYEQAATLPLSGRRP